MIVGDTADGDLRILDGAKITCSEAALEVVSVDRRG